MCNIICLGHLAIKLSCFNILSLHTFSFSYMLFSLLKHYLDLGVENYFPRLWGTGIPDAIFIKLNSGNLILI